MYKFAKIISKTALGLRRIHTIDRYGLAFEEHTKRNIREIELNHRWSKWGINGIAIVGFSMLCGMYTTVDKRFDQVDKRLDTIESDVKEIKSLLITQLSKS